MAKVTILCEYQNGVSLTFVGTFLPGSDETIAVETDSDGPVHIVGPNKWAIQEVKSNGVD